MHLRPLAPAAALALALPPGAQQPLPTTPQPTFVRVERADGRPLPGAVVTWVGCLPHVGELGPRVEHHVSTDARGRAHADLEPHLCWVVWAVGPDDGSGARAVAPPLAWCSAGAVATLRCDDAIAPRRVTVLGAAAWAHAGPLRCVARTPGPGIDVDVPLVDGELVLPHGPFVQLEVQTADGRPLWQAPAGADALQIPPPRRVPVVVVDAAGAPIAGARVALRTGRPAPWRVDDSLPALDDRQRHLGVAGPDGACDVEVPYPTDPLRHRGHGELLLLASAPGRAVGVAGIVRGIPVGADGGGAAAPAAFRCVLEAVEPLRGSLGRVAAGTSVHVAVAAQILVQRGFHHDARTLVAPVAADGTFVFDTIPGTLQSLRATVVPPAASATPTPLFPAGRERALPSPWRTLAERVPADAPVDVAVVVQEPDGGPARGRVVLLASISAGIATRDATVRVPLDARGATTLRLAPGRWVVAVCCDAGWVARELDVVPATAAAPLRLTMQPLARLRLELRDEVGAPVAAATVASRGGAGTGTRDPVQSVLQGQRAQWVTRWSRLRTDTDGRVELPFVPIDGLTMRVGLEWPGGTTADVAVEAVDAWRVVRPR